MTLEPRVYTPQEYADTMKVSLKTIYRQLRAGTLKAQRIGRQWRIVRTIGRPIPRDFNANVR